MPLDKRNSIRITVKFHHNMNTKQRDAKMAKRKVKPSRNRFASERKNLGALRRDSLKVKWSLRTYLGRHSTY